MAVSLVLLFVVDAYFLLIRLSFLFAPPHRYSAALPDELTLRPGMKLTVLRIYDDGWATGIVIEGEDHERGKQGAYPTVCVTVDRTSTSPNPTGTGSGSPNTRRSDGESEGSH